MLLGTQKKLFDAENTLEKQTGELEDLRALTMQQQTELSALRDAYYDGQVDVSLAQHDCQTAQAAKATAIAEVRHLTQILVEQTNATQNTTEKEINDLRTQLSAAQNATKDMDFLRQRVAEQDQKLEANTREMADMTVLLNQSETRLQETTEKLDAVQSAAKDAEALRQRVAEQEQQLEANTREMADMTVLLNQSETRLQENADQLAAAQSAAEDAEALRQRIAEQEQLLEAKTLEMADMAGLLDSSEQHWQENSGVLQVTLKAGQAAVAALIEPPDTLRLDQERLNRAAAALVESGAFDAEWYLARYVDVAESGADPALHFIEFGLAEGRAPRALQ